MAEEPTGPRIIEVPAPPGGFPQEVLDMHEADRRSFASKSKAELVAILNLETQNKGWVSRRAIYLKALREAFRSGRFDLTEVGNLDAFPGNREFVLEGNKLLWAKPAGS
jgi:hypothetical protein